MHGDAADFLNESGGETEYKAMRAAANRAGNPWIEPPSGPCQMACVHADWRFTVEAPSNDDRQTLSPRHVKEDIASLQSSDWQTRSDAFYRLLGLDGSPQNAMRGLVAKLLRDTPEESDAIKLSLIALLTYENSVVQSANRVYDTSGITLAESYTDYYGDVVWAISLLKDVRAIDALFGAVNTGHMAIAAIAQFGEPALDPAIVMLTTAEDPEARQSAALIVSEMLDPGNVTAITDPITRAKLKNAILMAARDEDFNVRIVAVTTLAKLRDCSLAYVAEALAQNDPYEASEHGGANGLYPVREAARNALTLLAK